MGKGGYNPKPYKGRPTNSHQRGGQKKGCCAMVEAGRAARRRNWPLARRYVRYGAHVVAARIV